MIFLPSSLSMEVAFALNDLGRMLLWKFTFMPTPRTTLLTCSFVVFISASTPQIFLPFTSTSLGHFVSALKSYCSRRTSATAKLAVNVSLANSLALFFGLRIIESHRPPAGEVHDLPFLPCAAVCIFANVTVPSAAPVSASCFAQSLVESTLGLRNSCFPKTFVRRLCCSCSIVMFEDTCGRRQGPSQSSSKTPFVLLG